MNHLKKEIHFFFVRSESVFVCDFVIGSSSLSSLFSLLSSSMSDWEDIRLFVFDFDGTLTTRNVTSRGVTPVLIDSILSQAGLTVSGPLLRNCLQRIKEKGKYASIASFGDSHVIGHGKIGGGDTIQYALSHFVASHLHDEREREEFIRSHLLSVEAFMPSQQWSLSPSLSLSLSPFLFLSLPFSLSLFLSLPFSFSLSLSLSLPLHDINLSSSG